MQRMIPLFHIVLLYGLQTTYAVECLTFEMQFSQMKTLIKLIKWEQQGYSGNRLHPTPAPQALNPSLCQVSQLYPPPSSLHPSIHPLTQAGVARDSSRQTLSFSLHFPHQDYSITLIVECIENIHFKYSVEKMFLLRLSTLGHTIRLIDGCRSTVD